MLFLFSRCLWIIDFFYQSILQTLQVTRKSHETSYHRLFLNITCFFPPTIFNSLPRFCPCTLSPTLSWVDQSFHLIKIVSKMTNVQLQSYSRKCFLLYAWQSCLSSQRHFLTGALWCWVTIKHSKFHIWYLISATCIYINDEKKK